MIDNELRNRSFARNAILLVLFVMIVICSLIAVSYAYYTTPSTSNTLLVSQTVSVDCLNITATSQNIVHTPPQSFYAIADSQVLNMTGTAGSGVANTGGPFGIVGFTIQNNCAAATSVDVIFVPDSSNTMPPEYIKSAYCANTPATCAAATSTSYDTPLRWNNSEYYNASSTPTGFWSYMATTFNLKSGAYMYSLTDATPISIAASSSKNISYKYWLLSSASNYHGLIMSGKFVVYTVS